MNDNLVRQDNGFILTLRTLWEDLITNAIGTYMKGLIPHLPLGKRIEEDG